MSYSSINDYVYGSPWYDNLIFILKFNKTSGATLDTQYLSDQSWSQSMAIKERNNDLYLTLYWNNLNVIVIQNSTDSSFSYYTTTNGVKLHDLVIESDNRIQISGHRQALPWMYYSIQTFPETISSHYNITSSSFTFSIKSSTNYPVVSGALSNYSLVEYSMSVFTLTYITDTLTYLSGVDYWVSDTSYWYGNTYYTLGLQSLVYYEIDINITCSVSGSTTITYALISNDNETVPSWVILDSFARKLKFTTPELNADTNFTFSVEATVNGDTNTYINKYYLEVLYCLASNCIECVQYYNRRWNKWQSGYEVFSDYKVWVTGQVSDETVIAIYTTNAILILSILISFATNIATLSTPQMVWLLMCQFQLIMILPLLVDYMPKNAQDYCAGIQFILLSLKMTSIK